MYLPFETLRSVLVMMTLAGSPVAGDAGVIQVTRAVPEAQLLVAQAPASPAVPRPAPKAAPAKAAPAKAAAPAKTPEADDAQALVQKVQSFYENTKDFTARFQQTYKHKAFGRTMESTGTVAFAKPALMRWDYDAPREKSFIVDGKDLWIWTPEDQEAVRRKGFTTDGLSASITFLWGKGRLTDEFEVTLQPGDRLLLTPKRPQGGYDKLVFLVDPSTGRVRSTTVIDSQGNENLITFQDVRLNTGLSADRFHFTPPKGAEVKELSETGLH